MHALDDTTRLLDLLREAGEEAVTLDELEVAGVRDPAAALLTSSSPATRSARLRRPRGCVRLGPARARADAHAAPRVAAAPAPGSLVVAVALLLLALLVASRRARHGRSRGTHAGTARR